MLILGRKKPNSGDDIGGVVILFESFLQSIQRNKIQFDLIDLNWRNYNNKMFFLLTVFFVSAKEILFSDHKKISFHGTTIDFTYYAPFVVFLSKSMGKRVTLRKFGGNFDLYYDKLDFFRRGLVTFALKNADCVFFETKYLMEKFSWIEKRVWFPNVRDINSKKVYKSHFKKRFVFISHVKETKGVNVILEAIQKLPEDYIIHIYGPKQDYLPPDYLSKLFNIHYKGVLQPQEVLPTLNNYDVLLLPSFHEGEGYPGAIIEAYSQGLPVISTRWRSIPEIVKHGKTGFLIKPESAVSLLKAIKRFNQRNYKKLSEYSLKYFENFDEKNVMKRILSDL